MVISVVGQAFVEVLPLSTGFAGNLQRQLQSQVTTATAQVNSSLTGMQALGKKATLAVAAGIIGVAVESVHAATKFDTLTLSIVTGAGESQKNLDMIRQGILQLSPAMGQSAASLAQGLYMIESAGFHGAAGLAVLKASAEGAKVGNADLATVANAVTTALTDYHLPASQAASVTSMLVETVASGKTHMQDLAGALSAVLPVAAAAHVNLADVAGAIATMTGQGISAQQATQDLANTIRQLQNPSQQAASLMEQFGLSSIDVSQNLGQRGLSGTLDVLVNTITQHMGPAGLVLQGTFKQSEAAAKDAQTELANLPPSLRALGQEVVNGTISQAGYRKELKGMSLDHRQLISELKATVDQSRGFSQALKSGTPEAKTMSATLAEMLGGATGLNVALALTGPNMVTYQQNIGNIAKAGKDGASQVQGFALVQKDFGFQVDQAKGAVGALFIEIGQHLIPIIQGAIHVGVEAVHWLTDHKTAALALAGVIGGALLTVMGAYVVLIAGRFLSAIGRAASSITSLITKIVGMGSASTASAAEQEAAAAGTEATNATLEASITSLNMSVQALVTTLGGELPAALELVAGAEEETAAISEETGGGFGPMGIAIGGIILGVTLLATHWKLVWRVLKEAAGDAWHWIDKNVIQPVKSVVEPAIRGIEDTVKSVVGGIETAFKAIEDWFKKWWPILLPIVSALFLGPIGLLIGIVVDEIILHWHTLWNVTKTVFGAISDAIMAVWHFIDSTIIRPILGPLVAWIGIQWGIVSSVARFVFDLLKVYFTVWWDVTTTVFRVALDVVKGILEVAWNSIKGTVTVVWDGIKAYFTIWWDLLRAVVQIGWDLIRGIFTVALDLITGKWGAAWNAIKGVFSSIWDTIRGTASDVWGQISGFFTGALNTFVGFWTSTWGTVESTFTSIWGAISGGVSGIWDGIKSGISAGIRDVENIINSAFINPINLVLGIFGVKIPTFNTGGAGPSGGPAQGLPPTAIARAEAGMIVNAPRVLVGEGGRGYPEVVIPTDPQYRKRAYSLLGWALSEIGTPGMAAGGIFDPGKYSLFDPRHYMADTVKAAVGPMIHAAQSLVGHIPPAFIGNLASGFLNEIYKVLFSIPKVPGLAGGVAGGATLGAMVPTAEHLALIQQALGLAGAGDIPANEAAVNIVVTHESGWNPRAINLTDINAVHGDPSRGLMQCVTLNTRILTRRGWLAHDEVMVGDETLGYNAATGRNEWTPITKIVYYEDAPVWRIGHRNWHADVTPNHRWWSDTVSQSTDGQAVCPECGWQPRGHIHPAKGVQVHRRKVHGVYRTAARRTFRGEFVRTEDLHAGHRIRLAAPADTDGFPTLSLTEVAVLAWLQGDGHLSRAKEGGWDGAIYQSKPPMVTRVRALLAGTEHGESVRQRRAEQLPAYTFRLRRAWVTDLMKRAEELPALDPESFVLRLSPEQRAAWLAAMIDAEGNRMQGRRPGHAEFIRITQVDGPLQEAIRLAVYLEGFRPTYSANSAERNGFQPAGSVGMARPHVAPSTFGPRREMDRQPVWCVKTPLETWTAGLDGQVFLTGNTIMTTFEAYRDKALPDDIYDPLANLVAGIRYGVSRYGSLERIPGVVSVAKGGPYVGYDSGGWLMPGVTMAVNATGRPEPVYSPTGAGPGGRLGGITLMSGAVQVKVDVMGDTSTGAGVEQLVEAGVKKGITDALNDVLDMQGSRNLTGTRAN